MEVQQDRGTEIMADRRVKHGFSSRKKRHPLHTVITNIKQRCYNSNHPQYKDYGGRGITVWWIWRESNAAFIEWGIANGWGKGLDINRLDNNGPYSPENCNFVTRKQNTDNRRMRWDNKAGYFGVCYIKEQKNWHASCFTKELGRQHHLGNYDSAEEAAIAYDRYLDQIGDNRRRNFPEPKQVALAI